MTKKTINLGTTANDGSGDTLRQAGQKINENFDEVYAGLDSAVYEAPVDSNQYVRINASWEVVNILPDAPADGTPYNRQDSAWVAAVTVNPADGKVYGRLNSGWTEVLTDANSDGSIHARRNGAWEAFEPFVDAPGDGRKYIRQDSAWVLNDSAGIGDAPNDGRIYARQNLDWVDVNDQLFKVVTEAPVDGNAYVRKDSAWALGVEELAGDSNTPYARQDGTWVETVPEANSDGTGYIRRNGNWIDVNSHIDVLEAPIDSNQYTRRNGNWQLLTAEVEEAPEDSALYARQNAGWTQVSVDSAPRAGVSQQLDTMIDSMGAFTFNSYSYGGSFDLTLTVGNDSGQYDFRNPQRALRYLNFKRGSPYERRAISNVILDCSNYDVTNRSGWQPEDQYTAADSNLEYDGSSYGQYGEGSRLSFNNYDYRLIIRDLELWVDSDPTGYGLINPSGNEYGGMAITGGGHLMDYDGLYDYEPFNCGVVFHRCSFPDLVNVTNASLKFFGCRFPNNPFTADSSQRITMSVKNSFLYFEGGGTQGTHPVGEYGWGPRLTARGSSIYSYGMRGFSHLGIYDNSFFRTDEDIGRQGDDNSSYLSVHPGSLDIVNGSTGLFNNVYLNSAAGAASNSLNVEDGSYLYANKVRLSSYFDLYDGSKAVIGSIFPDSNRSSTIDVEDGSYLKLNTFQNRPDPSYARTFKWDIENHSTVYCGTYVKYGDSTGSNDIEMDHSSSMHIGQVQPWRSNGSYIDSGFDSGFARLERGSRLWVGYAPKNDNNDKFLKIDFDDLDGFVTLDSSGASILRGPEGSEIFVDSVVPNDWW